MKTRRIRREPRLSVPVRLEAWLFSRLLPLLLFRSDMTALTRLARSELPRLQYGLLEQDLDAIRALTTSVTRKPWLLRSRRCLRQSLVGSRLLRRAGLSHEIVFSVGEEFDDNEPLKAHCWLEIDGVPAVGEPIPQMIEVMRVPIEGRS